MKLHEKFNQSAVSKFINSKKGRAFRLITGLFFLVVGYIYRDNTIGIILIVLSILPLSAGIFNLCYISAFLGGPISSVKINNLTPNY